MGAAVEGLAAEERRRFAGNADLEQHLAVERALAHGVVAVVGAIDGVVWPHVDAVRAMESALAPRFDEVALAVEHDHRVLAAVEDVDAVLAVDADGSRIAELPTIRQLGPILGRLVGELSLAQDHSHGRLSPMYKRVTLW